jgi:hypothetical protein
MSPPAPDPNIEEVRRDLAAHECIAEEDPLFVEVMRNLPDDVKDRRSHIDCRSRNHYGVGTGSFCAL